MNHRDRVQPRRRRRVPLAGLTMVATILTSCGDGDGEPTGGAPPAALDELLDDPQALADATTGDVEAIGESVREAFTDEGAFAVVTVGDQRWEFDQLYCVVIGGAVSVQNMGDGPDLEINIPPDGWETSGDDGWEPPSVRIWDDDFQYKAGSDLSHMVGAERLPDGAGQIHAYASDGHQASGTATFVDTNELWDESKPAEVLDGTFELSCPR